MPLALKYRSIKAGGLLETKEIDFWLGFKSFFLKEKPSNPLYQHWLEPIKVLSIQKILLA